ncbi:MAG: hypothetical protein WBB29_16360, partial [Geitlerinemataceae cyanobacterium]
NSSIGCLNQKAVRRATPSEYLLSKRLEQLDAYLARFRQDFGRWVIFDKRDNSLELKKRLKTEIHVSPLGRYSTGVASRSITVIRV